MELRRAAADLRAEAVGRRRCRAHRLPFGQARSSATRASEPRRPPRGIMARTSTRTAWGRSRTTRRSARFRPRRRRRATRACARTLRTRASATALWRADQRHASHFLCDGYVCGFWVSVPVQSFPNHYEIPRQTVSDSAWALSCVQHGGAAWGSHQRAAQQRAPRGGAPPAPACRGRACRGLPSPATTRTWHCAAGNFRRASVPEQRRSEGERRARGSAFRWQEARDRTSLTRVEVPSGVTVPM